MAMKKLVVLKLEGNLEQGVRVTLEIGKEGDRPAGEISGQLPPHLEMATNYRDWRSTYRSLRMLTRGIKPKKATTDGSIQKRSEECRRSADELRKHLNLWLRRESFLPIREKWLEQLSPSDEVRLLIRSPSTELLKLPWCLWDFVERYPKAEVALSAPESERPVKAKTPTERDKVRILAILGNSEGIDVQKDRQLLDNLPDAETTFLVEPLRKEINDQLWEQTWDILFFAGHSETKGETGRIHINQTDSLTIEELRYALKKAISRGLQLAIFNSCDGLGLAWELEQLHIPQIIVMREPVPDAVAQEFLKYFLPAFASGQSLYLAEREARQRLQGLEDKFPSAFLLPVICQNPAVMPPTWQDLGRRPTTRCPYRGLFAFREEDAPFFFGREACTESLVEAVQKQPLVAVIGPSGSGKSSVVFAGLIPQLPKTVNWRKISFRPGDRPLNALAGALIREMEPELSQSDRLLNTRTLADHLRQKAGGLRDVADEFVWGNPNTRLLLVADQFEELYTLCQDESERRVFLDRLLEAVDYRLNFCLVITLRADFFGQALSYRPFADALQYADLKLGPMNREEMEQAISKPAELLGVTIEQGLTERILDAVSAAPGDLPLLEFALTQLWQKQKDSQLTHATYDEIGGVEEALARYAEEAYGRLNEEEKERAQRVFVQLVRPGDGTEDTRRLATRKEVGEENWDLVTRLANARLVVTDTKEVTGEETVEIVHEALINGWERLRQWLETDRTFRTWQERLRAALRQWEASKRDEGALLRGAPLAEAEGWLKERPVELSPAERVFIWKSLLVRSRQRQRLLLGLSIGLVAALLLAGTAVLLWQSEQRQRKQEENRAVNAQISARAASAETLFALNQELEARIESIKVAKQFKQVSEVEDKTWGLVYKLLQHWINGDGFQERNRLLGYTEPVTSVSFSPDGQTIATTSGNVIQLWSREGKKLQTLTGHSELVTSVSFSPDGQTLASASKDKSVKLWSLDGRLLKTLQGHQSAVYSVKFSPDGQIIASASLAKLSSKSKPIAGTVKLWSREGTLLTTLKGPKADTHGVISVSFSPDGQLIALASPVSYSNISERGEQVEAAGTVELWSRNGKLLKSLDGSAVDVSFSPDSKTLAAASDNIVLLWSRDGKKLQTFKGHSDNVTSVSFSPDGKTLASTSADQTVKLWDINGKEIQTLKGHSGSVFRVSFSPDGQTLATASADKTVRLWSRYNNDKLKKTLEGYGGLADNPDFSNGGKAFKTLTGYRSVNSVSFSPDGQTIAAASGNVVQLWKRDGTLLDILPEFMKDPNYGSQVIWSASFSPNTKTQTLAWVTNNTTQIQNLNGGSIPITEAGSGGFRVRFSPDGKSLVTTSLRLWSRDGKLLNTFGGNGGHTDEVVDVSFSPDGQTIASASFDRTVKLWRRDGTLLNTLKGHDGEVTSVSFSPDGTLIASASADKTVRLWSSYGTSSIILSAHEDGVNSVSFSPSGKMIATASNDKTVKLWSLDGQLLKTLEGHKSYVWDVSFSPDGKTLASGSADNTIILWDLEDIDELLLRVCTWAKDYLKNNPNVNESDRSLCDGIGMSPQVRTESLGQGE